MVVFGLPWFRGERLLVFRVTSFFDMSRPGRCRVKGLQGLGMILFRSCGLEGAVGFRDDGELELEWGFL